MTDPYFFFKAVKWDSLELSGCKELHQVAEGLLSSSLSKWSLHHCEEERNFLLLKSFPQLRQNCSCSTCPKEDEMIPICRRHDDETVTTCGRHDDVIVIDDFQK